MPKCRCHVFIIYQKALRTCFYHIKVMTIIIVMAVRNVEMSPLNLYSVLKGSSVWITGAKEVKTCLLQEMNCYLDEALDAAVGRRCHLVQ